MQTHSPSVELAAKILSAYVTRNSVPAGALPDLLSEVHRSITALDQASQPQIKRPTDAQIRASVRPDTIISFEDGKAYKQLIGEEFKLATPNFGGKKKGADQ